MASTERQGLEWVDMASKGHFALGPSQQWVCWSGVTLHRRACLHHTAKPGSSHHRAGLGLSSLLLACSQAPQSLWMGWVPSHPPGLVETPSLWASQWKGPRALSQDSKGPHPGRPQTPQQSGQLRSMVCVGGGGRGYCGKVLAGTWSPAWFLWDSCPAPPPPGANTRRRGPGTCQPALCPLQPLSFSWPPCPGSLPQKGAEAAEALHQPLPSGPRPPLLLAPLSCSWRKVWSQQDPEALPRALCPSA